jgi:hypothetical protein
MTIPYSKFELSFVQSNGYSVWEVADECGISVGSLDMHHIEAEFVPQLLTNEKDFLTKTRTTVIP